MTSGTGQTSTGAGADFVVVANRLPVDLVIDRDGTEQWKASPGGLVTALESILKANDGAWVGWPGVPDAAPEPFDTDGIRLHSVPNMRLVGGGSPHVRWPHHDNPRGLKKLHAMR